MQPTVKRMYDRGPYRRFSDEPFPACVPYQLSTMRGYGCPFICGLCQQEAQEVVFAGGEWTCKSCANPTVALRDHLASARKKFAKDNSPRAPRPGG
jgi:hypothetical protein